MRKIPLAILLLSSSISLSETSPIRPKAAALSESEAAQRARRVRDVDYALSFSLDAEAKDFSGHTVITFQLSAPQRPLTIDFSEGEITDLKVNGAPAKADYNGFFLTVPASSLHEGPNSIEISFTHPYSQSGSGFYRFKDPEDGLVYLYTDFEPYRANQLFPGFDQPDLKASYRVEVEAPASWTVISTARETSIQAQDGQRKLWSFPKTARLSSYVFSLIAGPYASWESKAGAIPLRLFARRSVAKWVDSKEWFRFTQQGLAYYQREFGYPYPFKKYDQILVPDFNEGAMENIGAVTFTENLLSRGPSTEEERRERANTILHEMAHMWFGDLVTMKWWNDLWLNESFATYMASCALDEGVRLPKTWLSFYGTKNWAYWEDQLVTTHPIEADVPSTQQAFANFDGITYGKGASTLKQLAFFLGRDHFREGVRRYFKQHAFGNARRQDFMSALSEASKQNLDSWASEWLGTEGVNTIEARFDCLEGKTAHFKLLQRAEPEHPTLRSHRTVIGFYGTQNGHVRLTHSQAVTYTGAETPVPTLNGLKCPELVYPNEGDQDYVKVRLDPRTLEAAKSRLGRIESPLTRMMFWESHWDMVAEAEFPLKDFADLAMANLPSEEDDQMVMRVLGHVQAILRRYLPRSTPEQRTQRDAFVARVNAFVWKNLQQAKAGSDLQKIWFEAAVGTAEQREALDRIRNVLTGSEKLPGLVLDADRRWRVVRQLSEFNHPEAEALIKAEKLKDPSNEGLLQALTSEILRPDLATKEHWFERLAQKDPALKLAEAKAAMQGMFPSSQEELQKKFADRFYGALEKLEKKDPDAEFTHPFASHLAPDFADTAAIEKLGEYIAHHLDFKPVVLKSLRINKQEAERTLKVRQALK